MFVNIHVHPRDIRFSQSSISNKFSMALNNQQIGKVLDKICKGDLVLLKEKILKNMKVGRWNKPGFENLWFTVNNRSLWVLKELEVLGRMGNSLEIQIDPNGIDEKRFTTKNQGVCVAVRGGEVGGVHKVDAPFWEYKQQAISGGFKDFAVRGGEVGGVHKVDAPFWEYKQQAISGGLVFQAADYDEDDGYDSDEYYS